MTAAYIYTWSASRRGMLTPASISGDMAIAIQIGDCGDWMMPDVSAVVSCCAKASNE